MIPQKKTLWRSGRKGKNRKKRLVSIHLSWMFVMLHRRQAQKVVSDNKLNRNEGLENDILSFMIAIQREKKNPENKRRDKIMKNKRNGSSWNKTRNALCTKAKECVLNTAYGSESRAVNEADEWKVAEIWHSLLTINHSKYQEQKSSTSAQCWAWNGRYAKDSIKS